MAEATRRAPVKEFRNALGTMALKSNSESCESKPSSVGGKEIRGLDLSKFNFMERFAFLLEVR